MAVEVKILADSIGRNNRRITTFQLKYWRGIHAEMMTHRMFSRNASSSRAIPVAKMIEQVRNDPAMPIHWGKNIPGMQANEELIGIQKETAVAYWKEAANSAAEIAEGMLDIGLHKQVANRILEPFQWIHVVVTATDYTNFFNLRAHKDAQPEIQELAVKMLELYNSHKIQTLAYDEWHLPYITEDEQKDPFFKKEENRNLLCKISSARCARVSYKKHDGAVPSIVDDIDLVSKLMGNGKICHLSPFEHAARCSEFDEYFANFRGWQSYRYLFEKGLV